MFAQAVLPDTLRAIQLVAKEPFLQKAYLAGGTALALQIGHRVSVDLDFFTGEKFDESTLLANLRKLGLSDESSAWMTVKGKLGQTDFSLFYYEYPLVEATVDFEGIRLTNLKDIAAMKLHALEGRVTKRGFLIWRLGNWRMST